MSQTLQAVNFQALVPASLHFELAAFLLFFGTVFTLGFML
jgi:hypothetical protein